MADEELVRLDQVKPERFRFIWRDRIPYGAISVVAGKPDQGKGLLAAHIAAQASRKGNVLYSAIEDSDGSMTRPRLEAAGANMEKVWLWGGNDSLMLPAHLARLERHVREHKIKLIVLDPIAAHLGQGASRNSDSIRRVTNPLKRMAEKYKVAILIVDHVIKRVAKNAHPLSAIGGSGSGLPSAARTAYMLGKDPQNEEAVVMCPIKYNIGDWPLPCTFEIDVVESEQAGSQPALVWDQELSVFDPMLLLAKEAGGVGRPPDKRAAAAEWLAQYLAEAGKPVLGSEIMQDAKQYGISEKTIRRAAQEIGVIKQPPSGKNCAWSLNDQMKKLMGLPALPAPPVGQPDGEVDGVDWDAGLTDLLEGQGDDE